MSEINQYLKSHSDQGSTTFLYCPLKPGKRIAFHLDQFSFRGSEIAVYDYAYYNQLLLNGTSIILIKNNFRSQISYTGEFKSHPDIEAKFKNHFLVYEYENEVDLNSYLTKQKVDLVYFLKSGEKELLPIINKIPAVVHCIFTCIPTQKFGDVYLPITIAVNNKYQESQTVPHIVHKPINLISNFRDRLGIPDDAIVYGRHGGYESFDIPFVQQTVIKVAKNNPKIFFIFLATNNFCKNLPTFEEKYPHNIIFLPVNCNPEYKQQFINSCDAMIHGRKIGESFGYAVAEFSVSNKPVLTYRRSLNIDEKINYREHLFHHYVLGEKGLYYQNEEELEKLLTSPLPKGDFDCYSDKFSPSKIMNLFENNIITPLSES